MDRCRRWASTIAEKVRAKSYGYDATMELKEMDESIALAEINSAVTKEQNIVFYCYSPHHMFVMHKLVPLKEEPHDPAKWKIIQPTDDPEWLESRRRERLGIERLLLWPTPHRWRRGIRRLQKCFPKSL